MSSSVGADMSSSFHANNRTKNILVLGFCVLFINGTETHKFKAKDSEIVVHSLCLGNISKDSSVDNMKKTGLNGYVYGFSVDYDAIAPDDILGIHKYLMEKNNII